MIPNSGKIIVMVGGHHNVRNCIKGSGRLRTTALEKLVEAETEGNEAFSKPLLCELLMNLCVCVCARTCVQVEARGQHLDSSSTQSTFKKD